MLPKESSHPSSQVDASCEGLCAALCHSGVKGFVVNETRGNKDGAIRPAEDDVR